ncbi:MAG: hypothetical protein PWQ82_599 [Thermosediminibacterales bacterium]|nr:hypothetical protein [Thermosediminibacterales bacterium]MDK2835525.1 hypothetical protein [Thermosediminibacterales bacterium]
MNSRTSNEIFALDIGTRTVIGVVVARQSKDYRVLASEIREHRNRAMVDGQIHNVEEVANLVKDIKHSLEQKLDEKLFQVAVAAAGRALYTIKASARKAVSYKQEIEEQEVLYLEWEAVRNALARLDSEYKKENREWDYHCVGYSVVSYKLDGQIIGCLVGQKGKEMEVNVLATFLPRVVVDSLLTVIKKAGLKLLNLTLEPIAASHVIIPANMRKLNLALVDIGAGTSDIAITKEGSITAYGMVPFAGDEITEALCEAFVLDFDNGEALKREIQKKEMLQFVDIFGSVTTLEREQVVKPIEPVIEDLAKKIAEKVLQMNGKSPNAVILVGGGSQTPLLKQKLAQCFDLPESRVGIRGSEILNQVIGIDETLLGPHAVTPLGIAINAFEQEGLSLVNVKINGEPIQIFEFEKPTVVKALIEKGFSPSEIYGSPGMALTFEINGKLKIVKGGLGQASEIWVNGNKASLNTMLKDGDEIIFKPGKKGEDAKTARISDFITDEFITKICVNDKTIEILPDIYINGIKTNDINTEIPDGAKITFSIRSAILSDVFNYISIDAKKPFGSLITKVNGKDADFVTPIKNGDKIEIYWERASS